MLNLEKCVYTFMTIDHISKFEVNETHYNGKPKNYLNARLTIKKMCDMFITDNNQLKLNKIFL